MTLLPISIIGLGKLGLPFAVAAASRGFTIIGVEISQRIIDSVNLGLAPYHEPQLPQFLRKYRFRIRATGDYSQAVNNSDISFIIVPTPSLKSGAFSNKFVHLALKKLAYILRNKKSFHTIAIVSTVMPLSFDREFVKLVENESGKKIGVDVGLCYNPSFVALGNVINNILSPDLILIGSRDTKSTETIIKFHKRLTVNNPHIQTTNFVNAEISKIALNTYITAKISYGNMLAQLCEKTPGADSRVVTDTIGLDSRVGQKYLQGAIAYGGPCFPRDNRAFRSFGKSIGTPLPIAKATDNINRRQTRLIANRILGIMPKDSQVGIIGISYKENTDVVEESQGVKLAQFFTAKNIKVNIYDPLVSKNNYKLPSKTLLSKTVADLTSRSQVLIIVSPQDNINSLLQKSLTKKNSQVIIIYDLWGILNPYKLPVNITYFKRGQQTDGKKTNKEK